MVFEEFDVLAFEFSQEEKSWTMKFSKKKKVVET